MNPMNSIDEDTVRALLADVAGAPEPPSRISIDGRPHGRPPPAVGRPAWSPRAVLPSCCWAER